MIVFPNAKINIGLFITERRADGYHNLETVFMPVPLTDALEMAETGRSGISLTGIAVEGDPEDNLVLKAYALLKAEYQLPPVQFHLHKVIPPGSGLGGGSADAAFTLRMLNDYFDLGISPDLLRSYAARLGADCPFFIDNQPAFATGIGDQLTSINIDLSEYHLVVVKPPLAVTTRDAYRNVNPAPAPFSLKMLGQIPVTEWKDQVKNDFEASIFPEFPEIAQWKQILYDLGAVYAAMSGSGSALFALFHQRPSMLENKIPKSLLLIG